LPDAIAPAAARRVALLGTGIMGGHMARRLVEAGFDVTVWNRTKTKATASGAAVANSPSEAVANADVAIVILSDAAAIESVLSTSDTDGNVPLESVPEGATFVVMSSVPIEFCRKLAGSLAERGIAFSDAPVSGGEAGARDGTLAILGGGTPDVIARIGPVMAPLGRLTHIGPVGSGQLAKLANQIIVGGTMVAVAEALHFAKAGGADIAALREALLGGFGDSTILRQHGARMVAGDYKPGSPAMYQLKDLRTASSFADGLGVHATLLPTITAMFAAMDDAGDGNLDVAAIFREVERRSEEGAPA
jgi:3-hydroxyisobutyrate dehydrogenase-like beta-hydroxyacid dehydrogenase